MKEWFLNVPEYWKYCILMCLVAVVTLLIYLIFIVIERFVYHLKLKKSKRKAEIKAKEQRKIEHNRNHNKLIIEQARFQELAERNMKWN